MGMTVSEITETKNFTTSGGQGVTFTPDGTPSVKVSSAAEHLLRYALVRTGTAFAHDVDRGPWVLLQLMTMGRLDLLLTPAEAAAIGEALIAAGQRIS